MSKYISTNIKYLENIYNTIATDPIVIPGQKLSGATKNKKDIM